MGTVVGRRIAAMAESSSTTASVAERARTKYSCGGISFIGLEMLGTAPTNRSGLGVSGYHVHTVAASIRDDGFSKHRYRDCTVVRVPEDKLAMFRDFNRRMCASDPLLPAFSPSMCFAMLTKNHLAHALKLYASGTAVLHGTSERLVANPRGRQLETQLKEGLACEVMRSELWSEDPEGMSALVGEDNMDSGSDMAESEVTVLQVV